MLHLRRSANCGVSRRDIMAADSLSNRLAAPDGLQLLEASDMTSTDISTLPLGD